MDSIHLTSSFDAFKSLTKHPEVYLKSQNEKAEKIRENLLETIYTLSKVSEGRRKSKALPKLFTTGLDDESIWQQLEIQNEESFATSLKNVSKFLAASTDKFKLNLDDVEQDHEEELEEEDEENSEKSSENNENVEDEEENSELGEEEQEENLHEDEEEDSEDENAPRIVQSRGPKSIVDDQFFKLSDMEQWCLQIEDQRTEKSDQDDDTGIDMFSTDDTNREESMKYDDFFNEEIQDENGEEKPEESEEEEEEGPKSSHELKQERLKKKIEHLENAMLDNRPWQMKGEVKGDNRPQNSLLEEILEFDTTTRPAPIITEEVTMKLEDIIRQRIKDKAFDDVERKVKPSDIQIEYKKQLVLDQEKSKKSLAQIYEKEFVDQMAKSNPNGDDEEPEEPKEHKEIRADLKKLFEKLDLMSNFYYTPRPAQPELKIITNLPTISMEEVAPVAVSDAAMLAPEEVKRKSKGDVVGSGERTKTDKKRERRHKKVFQKQKFEKDSLSGKNLLEKVSKGRNVEKMKTSDETSKSSSAFFSKLQDHIALEKSTGKTNGKRKGEKPNHQAKKLKL